MGKNHSSVVVLRIWPKFWWMLPMGVRDNHTKYEPETQRWRPGTGVTMTGPPFKNLQFRAKISPFLPKTALEPAENGQMKGMPKQVFLARFELMVARFGPPKTPKCHENGLFCNQKWVKNGSKICSKNDPRPFGVHKQVK